MNAATAFPLCWPAGWRRTQPDRRIDAKFRVGGGYMAKRLEVGDGVERIRGELKRMGIDLRTVIISTELRLRDDGLPYHRQATSSIDPGAAVYWQAKGGKVTRCMAIDIYDRIADNLAAIAATIDAMRAIERHGGATILERAFTGFTALPAPASQTAPHEVLGVSEHATRGEIEYAYRRLAQQMHPDVGGSHESMSRINTARDAMLGALQ
jgi:hypothetical protein